MGGELPLRNNFQALLGGAQRCAIRGPDKARDRLSPRSLVGPKIHSRLVGHDPIDRITIAVQHIDIEPTIIIWNIHFPYTLYLSVLPSAPSDGEVPSRPRLRSHVRQLLGVDAAAALALHKGRARLNATEA